MTAEIKPGYERVSDILKPYSGMREHESMDKYKDRGTAVHIGCAALARGVGDFEAEVEVESYLLSRGYPVTAAEALPYVTSFRKWWNPAWEVLVHAGQRYYCDELLITGEPDLVARIDGRLTLVDYKTSKKPCKTWPMQLSAYQHLTGLNIEDRIIVQLDGEGSEPKILKYDYDMQTFRMCHALYNVFFKKKRRRVEEDLQAALD